MSLLIEQQLDNNFFAERAYPYYTSEAKIVPVAISQNGKIRFIWVIDEFREDTYDKNGKICRLNVYSHNLKDLMPDD